MKIDIPDVFFSKAINTIKNIVGVNLVYFLDNNLQVVSSQQNSTHTNYLEQITNIVKSESLLGNSSKTKPFYTYAFLNEYGVILVSKMDSNGEIYMVIIAGENEPVDLVSLLKICKETRQDFQNLTKSNV